MMSITHHADRHCFSTQVEGHTAHLDYTLLNHVMDITHTIVPEPIRGRGIAGQLMQAALEKAKEQGWKVIPSCSYAVTYLKRHPEFQDLVA